VDPLRLPELTPSGRFLAICDEKVFHAAENDVLMLKRDYEFSFAQSVRHDVGCRILGWPQVGLAALLASNFDVRLDKRNSAHRL